MLDFSTIFNQEIISKSFWESIKDTIIIFIKCLEVPIFKTNNNYIPYIPLWIPILISIIIPIILKKHK